LLDRGAGPVIASASKKTTPPVLADRQIVWAKFESDTTIRLRLTDSELQADLVALAGSASNANLLFNKQIALGGMPYGTAKAALITAATAVAAGGTDAASRFCLVGPGCYDDLGIQRGGSFAAAAVAAEVAKNADPSNDLDLWPVQLLTAIELAADGRPVFQRKVVTGAAVDDYEDLLVGGVSPIQPSRVPGGVATTHLRTVYTTNTQFDNLYTRVIVDQVFIDVKNYILDSNYLRMGNTQSVRNRIKSGVEAVLTERSAWIADVTQPDGTMGYAVVVTPSPDYRQITIGYQGVVVRGVSTVKVAANLTIPV
jgi:hypothetical protein